MSWMPADGAWLEWNDLDVCVVDIAYFTYDWQRKWPYEQLPRVTVPVQDSETLGAVTARALEALSETRALKFNPHKTEAGYWVAFYTPEFDEDALVPGEEQAARLLYGVRGDGSLVLANDWLTNITVGDLRRASPYDYRPGDSRRWVLVPPHGLGGGDVGTFVSDLVTFLGSVGIVVEAARGSWRTALWVGRRGRRWTERDRRRAAEAWRTGGIDAPWDLRTWIETKEEWSVHEVAERLNLPEVSAEELLRSVGYEQDRRRGSWIRSHSWRGRLRLARWMHMEAKFIRHDPPEAAD